MSVSTCQLLPNAQGLDGAGILLLLRTSLCLSSYI